MIIFYEEARDELQEVAESGNINRYRLSDVIEKVHYDDISRAIRIAAKNGHIEVIKFIMEYKKYEKEDYQKYEKVSKAIVLVLEIWDIEVIKSLLLAGLDVNGKYAPPSRDYRTSLFLSQVTPLVIAAKRGDIAIAQLLIENGANVREKVDDDFSYEPTAIACAETDEMKKFLRSYEDCLDYEGNISISNIKSHIESGNDVNIKFANSKTLLMETCRKGKFEDTITLISAGADINAKDKNGKSVLNYAAEGGNTKIMELLLARGAK